MKTGVLRLILSTAALLASAPSFAAPAPVTTAVPAAVPRSASTAAPMRSSIVTADKPAAAQATVRVLISSSREAKLSAQMDGRLLSLPKRAGESFARGDVLAEFDCSSQRAELAVASARLDKVQSTLDSQRSLAKLNAVSELELAQATADVAEAKARRQQAEVGVGRCKVLAPYAGRVVRRVANEYETLAPGATIIEVVENGPLRLELLVPSRWMAWLKTGAVFSVHVDELGRDVAARVTGLGSRVDPVSQTVSVQGVFTETVPGVLPGMSGNATFPGARP